MKQIYLTLIFFVCLNYLDAQYIPTRPYEKMDLSGLNPKWYHTYFDSDTDSSYIDNYSVFKDYHLVEPLIHEGKLYSITNSDRLITPQQGGGYYSGYYMTCLDIETGAEVWQYRYKVGPGDRVELPRYIKIDGNDIKIIGQKQAIAYTRSFFLADLVLFRRTLDINTGLSKYYFEANANNASVHRTTYPETPLFYEINDNEYKIIQSTVDSVQFTGFELITLDSLGFLKELIRYIPKKYIVYNEVYKSIGTDSLLYLESDYVDGINYLIFRYFKISENFKEMDEVKFVYNGYPDYLGGGDISPDNKKILLTAIVIPSVERPYPTIRKYVVDLKGNILNIVNRENDGYYTDIDWYSNDTTFTNLKWNVDDVDGKPIKSSLQLLNLSGDFMSTQLKEYVFRDSMRTALPYKFININEEEQISLWQEVALNIRPTTGLWQLDQGASAFSVIRHDQDVFSPSISSSIDVFATSYINVYPNPTLNCFSIKSNIENGTYDIYNISGHRMLSGEIKSEICIESFPDGMYILKLNSSNKKASHYCKIIKI